MAPIAWRLYLDWKQHQGFIGTGIRSVKREANGAIAEVPDGLIFPIIAAHSVFIRRRGDGPWTVKKPEALTDSKLIEAATLAYKEIVDDKPQNMGKSKACYSQQMLITSIYAAHESKSRGR